jgi:hypothetical protein
MTGWVKISRDVFDHPIFAPGEMTEREAWLWLIARAAWKDTKHRAGGELIDVPRGALFCTLRELCREWRWRSDTRVRSFLDLLERERMIERSASAGKTQITICNYAAFQDCERSENAQEAHEKRTENALKEEGKKRNISSLRSDICAGEAMLVSDGVEAETLADWKAVRKAKKAGPITETVAKGLIREASRAGLTTRAAVRLATERGWQGFRAEFVQQARAGPALRGSAAISDALDRILGDGDDQGKFEGIAGSVPGGGQRQLLTYRDGLLDGD